MHRSCLCAHLLSTSIVLPEPGTSSPGVILTTEPEVPYLGGPKPVPCQNSFLSADRLVHLSGSTGASERPNGARRPRPATPHRAPARSERRHVAPRVAHCAMLAVTVIS